MHILAKNNQVLCYFSKTLLVPSNVDDFHKHRNLMRRPDPLVNRNDTQPAFNVWPLLARQQNAVLMAFCRRAHDGSLLVVYFVFLIGILV